MKKNISIICAPFGVGGPNDAAKNGPSAMIRYGLADDLKELGFNVRLVKPSNNLISMIPKLKSSRKDRIKNIDAIIKVNEWLAATVSSQIKDDYTPLTIGGDHSLGIGTISGVHDALESLGVLWIDRHFDAHHPKVTVTWRAHGMPSMVAIAKRDLDPHDDFQRLLSIGKNKKLPKVRPQNFVYFGIGEKSFTKPNTKWFLMENIDSIGINKAIESAINHLLKRVKYIYIAWDIDAMSITGTGTHADSQLTLREGLVVARAIHKKIFSSGKLAGFEMMEIAPGLERKDLRGQTVAWANQLITTSFGGNLFNNLSQMERNLNIHATDL